MTNRFDIIDAAGRGYKYVWQDRQAILAMAVPVMLVKALCYTVILSLDINQEALWRSLVFLPAFFAEGAMLAVLVRRILLGLPDQDEARITQIKAATLIYVLINFLLYGLVGHVMNMSGDVPDDPEQVSASLVLGALAAIFIALWAFRLLWLYIPLAAGVTMREFLRQFKGLLSSFYMIAIWMISFVPFFVLSGFFMSLVLSPYRGMVTSASDLPLVALTLFFGIQIILEVITIIIATACMSFAVRRVFQPEKDKDS